MSSINIVVLTGNMTRDPEVNYAGQEIDRAKFGLAVNRKWTDRQSGEAKEEACFVDCTAWRRTASVIGRYCKKGSKIGIVGELKLDQWNAQDGSKRSKLTVTVRQVELLDAPPQDSPGYHGHYEAPAPQEPKQLYVNEDEIPF